MYSVIRKDMETDNRLHKLQKKSAYLKKSNKPINSIDLYVQTLIKAIGK